MVLGGESKQVDVNIVYIELDEDNIDHIRAIHDAKNLKSDEVDRGLLMWHMNHA